jgi:maltose-binding protein MalE/uncharacterized surface protein with fasciclin (FAS1) repeats
MNVFRKISILMLIIVVAVTTFGLAPQQEVDAQGGSLVVWHAWQDAEKDLLDTWVANFTAENDVEIETRFVPFDDLRATYESAAATGEGPDLLIGQADWAGGLADAGLILPIDDAIAGSDLDAQVSEAAWGTMAYQGSRYGTPVTLDGVSLFYNSDLIDEEDVPEDIEDLIAVGIELTEGDDVGLLFNNGFYHSAGIYFALGGQLFDENGANLWNTDDAAVAYLQGHQDIFTFAPNLINGDNSLFREGRAAMIVDGVWNLNTYREDLGDSLGVALLPDVDGEAWSPFVGGKGFYVNSTTENIDEAVAFLTYVTGDGAALGAEIAGHVPTNPNVELSDPLIATFAEQFSIGTPLPTDPAMGAYWEPLGAAITAVTEGGEDVEDAAAAAEATILDKLAPADDMGDDDMSDDMGDDDDMADDMDDMSDMGTIYDLLGAGESASLLAAIDAAGLGELLSGEGPYTVFAPVEDAFGALPPGTLEAVLADEDLLGTLLAFHVIDGHYTVEQLMEMDSVMTMAGVELSIELDEDGNTILNGDTMIVMGDIHASNGLVHAVDGILVP